MSRRVNFLGSGSSSSARISSAHIFDLSDEVLLMILEYLKATDLITLYRTCQRFRNTCQEMKFWLKIEDPPDDYESMDLILNRFLSPNTTYLRLSSKIHGNNPAHRSSFSPSFMEFVHRSIQENLPNPISISSNPVIYFGKSLTHLSLIRQRIDGRYFMLKYLPQRLKVLDLTGTCVTNITEESSYFMGISNFFEELEVLNLRECNWVTSHALLAISKCPALTYLSMRGCRSVGNSIAYTALACRFGFKTLQILDVTDTQVGSADLIAFSGIPNLVEYYFGQYDRLDPNPDHNITDQNLLMFANSPFLKVIDMSGSLASDVCVDILASIPNLTDVYAHFTQLTEGGITRLRNLFPSCRLHKCEDV